MKKLLLRIVLMSIIPSFLGTTNQLKDKSVNKIVFEDSFILNQINAQKEYINDKDLTIFVKLNYAPFVYKEEKYENNRKQLIEDGKKYHYEKNKSIIEELNINEDIYIDQYAPYFSYQTSVDEIENQLNSTIDKIVKNKNIKNIYIKNSRNYKPLLTNSTNYIGVRDTMTSAAYTGDGIKVGIIEAGIVNANHSNLVNSNITVRDDPFFIETITEHTTQMASIIGGVNGIAPNCEMYSVQLFGDPSSEVNWLIDNEVNLINMSYGEANPTGIYSSNSAYYDYICSTYRITFVASVGNEGEDTGYVTNPGLGYNVITVGACSSFSNEVKSFSSYKVNNGPQKPNILAPGYNMYISPYASFYEGTSLSAALTTGSIALLMQSNPILISHPERVASLLYTNANQISSSYFGSGIKEKVGVGVLCFDKALSNKNMNLCKTVSSGSSYTTKLNLNLNEGEIIRSSLVWYALSNQASDSIQITNFDLILKNSNSQIKACSSTINNPVEFIEYEIQETGTYSLEIIQYGTRVQTENLALYYAIE